MEYRTKKPLPGRSSTMLYSFQLLMMNPRSLILQPEGMVYGTYSNTHTTYIRIKSLSLYIQGGERPTVATPFPCPQPNCFHHSPQYFPTSTTNPRINLRCSNISWRYSPDQQNLPRSFPKPLKVDALLTSDSNYSNKLAL